MHRNIAFLVCTRLASATRRREKVASGTIPLAEIFIDAEKPGSAIAERANDAAMLASLLLPLGLIDEGEP